MKWQIIRMKCGNQQHYNLSGGGFKNSHDRWSGVFPATKEEAREVFKVVLDNSRKTGVCSLPTLHEIK